MWQNKIAKLAIDEADEIISSLVVTSHKLAVQDIARRRKEAPWRYVYCMRRAEYATRPIWERMWLRRARKWRAMAEANKAYPELCCLADMAMAPKPGGGILF